MCKRIPPNGTPVQLKFSPMGTENSTEWKVDWFRTTAPKNANGIEWTIDWSRTVAERISISIQLESFPKRTENGTEWTVDWFRIDRCVKEPQWHFCTTEVQLKTPTPQPVVLLMLFSTVRSKSMVK